MKIRIKALTAEIELEFPDKDFYFPHNSEKINILIQRNEKNKRSYNTKTDCI